MKYSIVLAALVIALIRVWMGFNVVPEPANWANVYKDVAHLFVGGLFVGWYIQRQAWQWRLFWALNVVEVAVAIASRM
jgi:hypothetical protein